MKSLSTALRSDSTLRRAVKPGLKAIGKPDRRRFDTEAARLTEESVDLDSAMEAEHPDEPRWDYLVSAPKGIVGVEPHPATVSEVQAVIRKKERSRAYLRNHLQKGGRITAWLWVASGRSKFVPFEPAKLRLDRAGIEFVGARVLPKHLK
jgi:hypothetical protein